METYMNLKKSTKIGLIISAVLCVAMLIFLIVNLALAQPPEMPAPPEGSSPTQFIVPGFVHIIMDMVMFTAILSYAFFGYKMPHGNMLRIVFFIFSVYLLAFACIDFMTKSTNYIGNGAVALAALLIAYISGRLNKLKKNKILLAVVGVLLCVAVVVSFTGDPNRGFDLITFICQSTSVIVLAALGFAYTARYEEHKATGLADKADEELAQVSGGDAPSILTKLDLEPGDFEVRL